MTLTKVDTDNLPGSQYDEMTRSSIVPQSWRSVPSVGENTAASVVFVMESDKDPEVARDDADMM